MAEEKPKENKFRSLKVELTRVLIGLCIGFLITYTFISIILGIRTQQRDLSLQHYYIAANAAKTVEGYIQEKTSLLQSANALGNFSNSTKEEQELILESLLGLERSFRQFSILDKHNNEELVVSRLSDPSSGNLMNHLPDDFDDQNEVYISPVYIDDITSEPLIVIAIPITNIFGDEKGKVLAEVNLKFMWELIDTVEVGDTGYAYVVDQTGDLIAFSDTGRTLKGEYLGDLKIVKEFLESKENTEVSKTVLSRGINNSLVLSTYEEIRMADWAVVVELPFSEAYRPITTQIILILGLAIILIILAIFISRNLSLRITEPLIRLRDEISGINEMGMTIDKDSYNNDEIGDLAGTFSKMTKDLKKSKDRLEEANKELEMKVSDRTKQLEEKMRDLERFNKMTVKRELKMSEMKKEIAELKDKLADK